MKRMHEITEGAIQAAEALSGQVESSGNTVTFGGNVEIDGNIEVNGYIKTDSALDLGDEETSSGTLTTAQYAFLANSPEAYIEMAGEKYYRMMNSPSGYMNYTCVDYANGAPLIKVITITVSTLAWVLSSQNVGKKTYFHPINLQSVDTSEKFILGFSVPSPQAQPFTKTTFKELMKSIDCARWMCTGSYYPSDGSFYLSPAYVYYNETNQRLALVGVDSEGGLHQSTVNFIDVEAWLNASDEVVSFADGVNAIS